MISRLGRYEVLGELGQGAMGIVYKARDPLIDRVVAIKTINLGLAQEEKEEYEGRFYQEARAAGRLNHPNIVTVYDVGKSGDIAYIAMEFLEGRELRDILDDEPVLPVAQTLDIVAQVADGLAYAHEHDIVHRDIKPANIMVVRDGHAKITDFGIARMAFSAVRTQTGMVLGSPKYMSPEQVMGKAIDQRSDIFSLGVMLYEMLVGQTPFNGENVNAITYQTLHTIPAPPRTLNPALPEMLNFIAAKALAKEPDDRYQNATDLAADLRACRDTLPPPGQQPEAARSGSAGEASSPDAFVLTSKMSASEEEAAAVPLAGLSLAFDSSAATMRLATLTGSQEDIEALARTLKTADATEGAAIPSPAVAGMPVAARAAPRPDYREPPMHPRVGNLLLILILLVILSVAALLVF